MPTATSTVTKPTFVAQVPLKAGLKPSLVADSSTSSMDPTMAQTSTSATLRSLYTRAARAFVLRDVTTTSSLLQSAFALLKPPSGTGDSLADDRRKWDILRITFESTVYTSPPSPPTHESLPESLRSILVEAPQALATSIYNRSLSLFTPSNGAAQKTTLNAAYLPSQVLTTLVYCSLKLDAPDVGRVIIEDWIARREPRYTLDSREGEGDVYEKVLELYCLHILPKLEQWDYAKEFLQYESELSPLRREHLKSSLNNLYSETMASRRPFNPSSAVLASPAPTSPRSYSPAPSSSSSSSSSLSTTSTHTIVPATPRGHRPAAISSGLSSLTHLSSSSSSSSNETATPRVPRASVSNGHTNGHHQLQNGSGRPHSKTRTHSSTSSRYSSLPRSHHLSHQLASRSPPSTYAVIRASLSPYLTNTKVTTFLVLFVLVPLISFVLRMRRRKQLMELVAGSAALGAVLGPGSGTSSAASNAELVRRRLQVAGGGSERGLFMRAWTEMVRAVGDTVRMAGSGLV